MLNMTVIPEPKEHFVVQGSDQWKALRIGKITGSKYEKIMPAKTAKNKTGWTQAQMNFLRGVAEEILTGESIDGEFKNSRMDEGTYLEPKAREAFSDYLMTDIRECGFFEVNSMVGDSPDGLIGPEGAEFAALEIKCPSVRVHLHYLDDPEYFWSIHKWQELGHMMATQRDMGYLISYNTFLPEGKQMVICEPPKGYRDDIKRLEDRLSDACVEIARMIK